MNLNDYIQHKTLPSLGLLALRLVMGGAFVLHGLGKIQNPTGWMGEAPVPGVLQAAAAFSEFGGGLGLILGLLTPLACLGIIGTMIGALAMVHLPGGDPFVNPRGSSFELPLVYLSAAVMFLLNSPGRFSIDAWLARKQKPAAFQPHATTPQHI
jgi:putative oxidoreductase